MDDFMPATVLGYSEWPKNTPNYWALPAMADAVGWTYRKDWFARPEIQAEFKKKYGRDLAPPKTYDELKQIAEFFQGREIDGKKVYGAYIFTERGSEGITMGVTNVALRLRLRVRGPEEALSHGGLRQLARRGQGARVLQGALQVLHGAGLTNAYMPEGLDAFKSGQVAMQMNWFAFFPGLYKDPNVGGDKIGFFVNPAEKQHCTQLGGQGISVVSYSDHKDDALQYIKWFAQPAVQKKWWELGGYSAPKAVVQAPGFPKSAPFAPDFLKSMEIVKDFWAEPPTPSSCSTCRSACMTTSSPTRARRRRRSICWSRTGQGLQGRRQDRLKLGHRAALTGDPSLLPRGLHVRRFDKRSPATRNRP